MYFVSRLRLVSPLAALGRKDRPGVLRSFLSPYPLRYTALTLLKMPVPETSEPFEYPVPNGVFMRSQQAAGQVLRRRLRLFRLIRHAHAKLTRNERSVARVGGDLHALVRLTRRWARREYRAVPWRSMLYTVAALLYFVNPLDALPDALVGLGFVDDVAVIGAVVKAIRKDLDAFRRWEKDRGPEHTATPPSRFQESVEARARYRAVASGLSQAS